MKRPERSQGGLRTPFSNSPMVTERRRSQWNCKLFESPSKLPPNEPSGKTKLNLLLAMVKKENFLHKILIASLKGKKQVRLCEACKGGVI